MSMRTDKGVPSVCRRKGIPHMAQSSTKVGVEYSRTNQERGYTQVHSNGMGLGSFQRLALAFLCCARMARNVYDCSKGRKGSLFVLCSTWGTLIAGMKPGLFGFVMRFEVNSTMCVSH